VKPIALNGDVWLVVKVALAVVFAHKKQEMADSPALRPTELPVAVKEIAYLFR
jgi:hypothetical protein